MSMLLKKPVPATTWDTHLGPPPQTQGRDAQNPPRQFCWTEITTLSKIITDWFAPERRPEQNSFQTGLARTGTRIANNANRRNIVFATFLVGMMAMANAAWAGLELKPTSHDFGSVTAGSSAAQQFIVSNTGETTLQLGIIESVDAITTDAVGNVMASTDFIVNSNCAGTLLSPGGECQFAMEFIPTSNGESTTTVVIPYYDASGNPGAPLTAPLKGTGIIPTEATLSFHDFGNLDVGQTSIPHTITLSGGDMALPIGQITLSGDDDFILSDICSNTTIEPATACTLETQFQPNAGGARQATLSIPFTTPNLSPLEMLLKGNGITPPAPNIDVKPLALDVGDILVGQASPDKTISLSNLGNQPLTVGQITLSGEDFELLTHTCSNQNMAPAESCSLSIRFAPQSVGAKTATLSIPSNDPDTPTVNVSLTGNGIVQTTPNIDVKPIAENFGEIMVGTVSPAKTISLASIGTAPLAIGQISLSGAQDDFELTHACSNTEVGPEETCSVSIRFAPQATGTKTATLSIPSNDPDTPTVTVELTGNGIAPNIDVKPLALDFDEIIVGQVSPDKNTSLSNLGNAPLAVGQISLSGDKDDFERLTHTCSNQNVAPSESCSLSIRFAPQSLGAKTATLSIPSNDPDTPNVEVSLTGDGIAPPKPEIEVKPLSKTFDDIKVGTASPPQRISLSNLGNAPLAVGQITLTGDQDDFKLQTHTCSNQTVAPSESCSLEIRFKPQSLDTKTVSLSIPSNDPETPTVTVALTGKGLGWCQGNSRQYFGYWPRTPNFGTELVGSSSTSQYQSVYSWARGCGALKIDTVTVTGDDAAEFSIKNKRCYRGMWRNTSYSSCWFLTEFSPTSAGTKRAELTLTLSDTSVKTIALQAAAVNPPGQPNITVSPSSHDFGTAIVGRGPYTSPRLIVTNTGNVNLKFGKIAMTGANAAEFKANRWNCYYKKFLYPSEQCYIYNVQFTPTSTGNKQAKLSLASNATTVEVPLTGTAEEPEDCSDASITIETRESGNWAKLVYVNGQWVFEGPTNAWRRLGNLQPDEFVTPNRPREDDVVRINAGHEIIGIPFAKVKTLCIEEGGKLTSLQGDNIEPGRPLEIQATDYIENSGKIWGMGSYHEASGLSCSKAQIGTGNCAYPGASVILKTGTNIKKWGKAGDWWWYSYSSGSPILNKGEIIAGNGGNGSQYGAPGGNAIVLGRNTTNKNAIKAGHGGDILGTSTGEGGRGGLTQIWGKLGGPGHLYNTNGAKAFAGDGGDCNPSATGTQIGGRGGNLWIVSLPNVHLSGGHHRAGDGGSQCRVNGRDGWVRIEPNVIDLSGANTKIEGGDVTIYGGKDWTLDLSNISGTVITASGNITLSVGEGGAIDMRGSTGTLFKTEEGQVNVFADEIVLDEEVALADVIEAPNIVAGPSKILRDVSLVGTSASIGEPDEVLPINITLTNTGTETDSYTISVSDTAGWSLGQLPPTLEVEALQSVDLVLNVTLPSTSAEKDMITVTAVSQNDPEALATKQVQVSVTKKPSGRVNIDPGITNLPGVETTVDESANVTIHATADDGTVNLSQLAGKKAINVTKTVTLAVGEGGVLDLRGINSTILEASEVVIFADKSQILLDPGVKLSDVITAGNIETKQAKPLRSVTLTGPSSLTEPAGTIVPVGFTLANTGLEADTYTLNVTDSAGWPMTALPTSNKINGLARFDLWLNVTLPSALGATNVITVTATSQADPTIVATAEVSLSVSKADTTDKVAICPASGTIDQACNNRGRVLRNATLESSANVSGGTFEGTITNKGLVSQATVEYGTVLRGGKLSGNIVNKGTLADFEFVGASVEGGELSGDITNNSQVDGGFINVRLAADTSITGGTLQGGISGDANAPAILRNVRIKSDSRLSNVIIGDNVQLAKDIELGEGVRFTRRADIPADVELINLLPDLSIDEIEGVSYPKRADLSADVLEPSDGILSAINELAALTEKAWVIRQNAELSHLELSLDKVRFAVLPVSVKKATASADLAVQETQRVLFITDTGLEVLTEPAVQVPSALQSALTALGVSDFTVQTNGNLQVPAPDDVWFSARPDWLSIERESDTDTGLKFGESPYVAGLISVSLVFTDGEGKRSEQSLYPAVAQPDALYSAAKAVSIEANGLVNFRLGNQSYRGVVDYVVTQGESSTDTLQVEQNPDVNGDGIEDMVLIYPNGERQILFVVE
jgi:hypothetical protein